MSQKPICACCGKEYGRRAIHSETIWFPKGSPPPPYRGNGIVLKERISEGGHTVNPDRVKGGNVFYDMGRKVRPEDMGDTVYRETWDGETYWMRHKPFCTAKCGMAFARACYKAGYRMKDKT